MKKLFFSIFALCMGMCAMAQSSVYVYQKDGKTLEIPVSNLDSISFTKPVEPLSGVFSVSADKTVKFAPGNLQYTQSTKKWEFAANQYEMLGLDNVTGGNKSTDATHGYSKYGTALADKIDLFGWSANNETAQWGISTSSTTSDYSGDFVDWGKNIGDGATWRSLTNDEWGYLLNTRSNAADLKGVARIKLSETEYVNGLILLPDSWTLPEGLSFTTGFSSTYSVQAYADYQTITLTDWQKLETAGALFLPAASYRDGTDVYSVQDRGNYFSATSRDTNYAYILYFDSSRAIADSYKISMGRAVRLVQDVE